MADNFLLSFDETSPVVTVSNISTNSISSTGTQNCTFDFSVDEDIQAYKIKIVSTGTSAHDSGDQIGTTNGSTNMSGTGTITSGTTTSCSINVDDFKAIATTEGTDYTVRIFCQDIAGNWN